MSNPQPTGFRSIPAIWSDAYKHSPKLKPILKAAGRDELESLDYGRAHALIHCLAAYLTWQRIKRGDVVLILAENTMVYYAVDLALQYLGAVNLTVPQDISDDDLKCLIERHQPHTLFLTSYERYNAFKSIVEGFVDEGGLLICYTTRHDELQFTDKLVTLEAAIDIGKDYWREHRGTLQQNQHKVQTNSPVTIVYPYEDFSGNPKTLSQQELTQLTQRLRENMPPFADNEYLLNACQPAWLVSRIAGFYVALMRREVLVLATRGIRPPEQMPEESKYYVLTDPNRLADTTNAAARAWTQKRKSRPKRLSEALAVSRERNNRLKKGDKLGFSLSMKFKRKRNKVLRPIYKQHLGHIKAWITFHAPTLPNSIRTFYRALDVPLFDAPYPHEPPKAPLEKQEEKQTGRHNSKSRQSKEKAPEPESTANKAKSEKAS